MASRLPVQAHPDFVEISAADPFPAGMPPDGELHVWELPVRAADRVGLSAAEMEQASRFHQTADADRFSSARIGLRRLAGAYLGIDPAALLITGQRHEKPLLGNPIPRPLHFNSSHSGDLVLIAFGGEPLGIDIEQMNPRFNPLELLDQFSPAERELITGAPDPPEAFYRLWTRKEALVKGWATGLQQELRQVPVIADLVRAPDTGRSWRLMSFYDRPGYAAALASDGSATRIRFYREI